MNDVFKKLINTLYGELPNNVSNSFDSGVPMPKEHSTNIMNQNNSISPFTMEDVFANRLEVQRSLYDVFYANNIEEKESQAIPYEEKMNKKFMTMNEVESLFYALSLTIGDSTQRQAFDNVFTNWKNDRLHDEFK